MTSELMQSAASKNRETCFGRRARIRRCDIDQTFALQSQSKTVSIRNQAKKSHNPLLLNNIGDGIFLPQAIPGGTGTRPKAGGAHERTIQFIF